MIELKFRCDECGCEKGEIRVDIHSDVFVECDSCEEREPLYRVGLNVNV